jgi:hypothetical protein
MTDSIFTAIETVIASEAKQSMPQHEERMDCFVASLLAMTARYTFAISPHVSRESCYVRSPSQFGGRRDCRASDAPDNRVCNDSNRAHTRWSGHTGKHPAFPAQWFYSLCRTLPGDRAFLSPSPLRSLLLTSLTPASRRQDHTILPSAHAPFVKGACSVHRILSRVRDDLEPPLCGTGQARLYR